MPDFPWRRGPQRLPGDRARADGDRVARQDAALDWAGKIDGQLLIGLLDAFNGVHAYVTQGSEADASGAACPLGVIQLARQIKGP